MLQILSDLGHMTTGGLNTYTTIRGVQQRDEKLKADREYQGAVIRDSEERTRLAKNADTRAAEEAARRQRDADAQRQRLELAEQQAAHERMFGIASVMRGPRRAPGPVMNPPGTTGGLRPSWMTGPQSGLPGTQITRFADGGMVGMPGQEEEQPMGLRIPGQQAAPMPEQAPAPTGLRIPGQEPAAPQQRPLGPLGLKDLAAMPDDQFEQERQRSRQNYEAAMESLALHEGGTKGLREFREFARSDRVRDLERKVDSAFWALQTNPDGFARALPGLHRELRPDEPQITRATRNPDGSFSLMFEGEDAPVQVPAQQLAGSMLQFSSMDLFKRQQEAAKAASGVARDVAAARASDSQARYNDTARTELAVSRAEQAREKAARDTLAKTFSDRDKADMKAVEDDNREFNTVLTGVAKNAAGMPDPQLFGRANVFKNRLIDINNAGGAAAANVAVRLARGELVETDTASPIPGLTLRVAADKQGAQTDGRFILGFRMSNDESVLPTSLLRQLVTSLQNPAEREVFARNFGVRTTAATSLMAEAQRELATRNRRPAQAPAAAPAGAPAPARPAAAPARGAAPARPAAADANDPREKAGQRLDEARAALNAAQDKFRSFGLRQQKNDPEGFAAARKELEAARAARTKAQQEWQKALGETNRAFQR
jgi:hypothetical protein